MSVGTDAKTKTPPGRRKMPPTYSATAGNHHLRELGEAQEGKKGGDRRGGRWWQVPECFKILHPLGVRIVGYFPLCANSPSLRPPSRPCCSSLIPSLCKRPDRFGRNPAAGAGLPFSRTAPKYPGARAGETAAARLRRTDVRGELRDSQCGRGRMCGRL